MNERWWMGLITLQRDTIDQHSTSRASFDVAWLIVRNKKPNTIGEELVKPATVKMAEIMCGQKEAMRLRSVPLSARAVKERISICRKCEETSDFFNQREETLCYST